MKKSGIYGIFNEVNGKVYIGSTVNKRGFNARWGRHKKELNDNLHINIHLQRAWNKYGKDNFRFAILEECSEDSLIRQEQAWIDCYNSQDYRFGYNIRDAGSQGHLSEETKNKIRLKMLGRKFSKESHDKMSKSAIGNKKWLGKHHSKESIQKISTGNLGKKRSEETCRKIGLAKLGKRQSPEHIQKRVLGWKKARGILCQSHHSAILV